LVGKDWDQRYRAHAWAVAAVLSHTMGALLAPLLFVPLLHWNDRERFPSLPRKIRYFAITGVVVAGIGWFAAFDWRRWGAGSLVPEGYKPPDLSRLRTPAFPFWTLSEDPWWNLAFVAAVLLGAAIAAALLQRRREAREGAAWVAATAASLILHQFAAAMVLGAIAVRCGIEACWRTASRHRWIVLAAGMASAFWLGAALRSGPGLARAADAAGRAEAIQKAYFGLPDFIHPFWITWSRDLPMLGAMILLAMALRRCSSLREPKKVETYSRVRLACWHTGCSRSAY
jgi:hypothetical protein